VTYNLHKQFVQICVPYSSTQKYLGFFDNPNTLIHMNEAIHANKN